MVALYTKILFEDNMEMKEFERKRKEDRPVLAICYDFDKTLSPDDMQAQGYIQSVHCDVAEFWRESNKLAEENDMDQNLAYMYKMKQEAEGKQLFTKEQLREHGRTVALFPGVEEWFERIRAYGEEQGVKVEHYIISSGLKEMIEGTSVARAGAFEKVYASSFFYNENGVAVWPAQVVNYTNKTQFLFRIEKGVLDVNDPSVNMHFAPEDVRIPFRNIVYIGDSDTDVPCMKLVNNYGGHSIGVFDEESEDKTKVFQMMRDERIKYFVPANYSEGGQLDCLLKKIIDKTAATEKLESIHYKDKKEFLEVEKEKDKSETEREEAIAALSSSGSFANTHAVIKVLKKYDGWSEMEIESLMEIAINNNQVKYILTDSDVRAFYLSLLNGLSEPLSECAEEVKKAIYV